MKIYLCLALVLSAACAAPFNGNFNKNVSSEERVKRVKAALYLFAPDSWVEKFDAIPQEGLKCFAGVVKSFKNDEVYSNDDFDEVKAELEAKCSTYKAELSGFFGTVSSTVKSLPESFLDAAKKFGSRVKSLSQKLKKAVSNKAQQRGNDPKKHAARLAKAAARFTDELAEISEADREQISNTFPKLEPFFSGDNSIEFINGINKIFDTVGSRRFDSSTLKNLVKEFKTTLESVWEEYSEKNAEGIQKASELIGQDISDIVESKLNGEFNGNGFPPQFGNVMQGMKGNGNFQRPPSEFIRMMQGMRGGNGNSQGSQPDFANMMSMMQGMKGSGNSQGSQPDFANLMNMMQGKGGNGNAPTASGDNQFGNMMSMFG